jgi:hypothetical protein
MFPIGTKPISLTGEGKRCPVGTVRLHGAEYSTRNVAKLVTAPFAFGVFEQKRLLAMLTEKKFHAQLPRCLLMTMATEGLAPRFKGKLRSNICKSVGDLKGSRIASRWRSVRRRMAIGQCHLPGVVVSR